MSCRKRGIGYEIGGKWVSLYKAHLYYGIGDRSEKGFKYPDKGNIMTRKK